jgi:hypothetical protein
MQIVRSICGKWDQRTLQFSWKSQIKHLNQGYRAMWVSSYSLSTPTTKILYIHHTSVAATRCFCKYSISHKLYLTRNAYTIKHFNIDQWWYVWGIVYVTQFTSWAWCLVALFDCWTMLVAKVYMLIRSQKERSTYHIFASLFCSSILLSLKTYLPMSITLWSKLYVFLPVATRIIWCHYWNINSGNTNVINDFKIPAGITRTAFYFKKTIFPHSIILKTNSI